RLEAAGVRPHGLARGREALRDALRLGADELRDRLPGAGLALLLVLVGIGDLRRHRTGEQTQSRRGDRRPSEPSYHNCCPSLSDCWVPVNGDTTTHSWLLDWGCSLPRGACGGQPKRAIVIPTPPGRRAA